MGYGSTCWMIQEVKRMVRRILRMRGLPSDVAEVFVKVEALLAEIVA